MKSNLGLFDRLLRVLIAGLLLSFYQARVLTGVLAIVYAVLALFLLVTAATGYCPLYRMLGINTRRPGTRRH